METAGKPSLESRLQSALDVRASLFDDRHLAAFRLFNGFLEGQPDLVVDLYARTLVVWNYAEDPQQGIQSTTEAQKFYLSRLTWLQAVLVKTRNAAQPAERSGLLTFGTVTDRKILENGVWYAVDLTLNVDASLYLDTRNVRAWLRERLAGKSLLNTFAYTGSLGVAAMAGGAKQVVQMDINPRFLNLAKTSYTLNGFPIQKTDFMTGDFWVLVNRLKSQGRLFDCVLVDPPFFSVTTGGRVDLVDHSQRVINKVRPLVGHGGWLVTINNALFVSGAAYMQMLQALCSDGYLELEERIPAPVDFTGTEQTRSSNPPADPTPFNHSTKVAVLRVKRKDQKTA